MKMRHIFLRSIIAESKDDLELSPREKAMIKWFAKYHISLIALLLCWYTPVIFISNHIEEYNALKENTHIITPVQASPVASSTPVVEKKLSYKELIDADEDLRAYVMELDVPRNNPGNLRCAGQKGSTCINGFANFVSPRDGFLALLNQISLDTSRKLSLGQFINKYSPPSENDTAGILAGAEKALNTSRSASLDGIDHIALAKYIIFREHSVKY